MSNATFNLTDLLRHPKDVLEQVRSAGQVRVTRRGDADLVILRSDTLDTLTQGTRLAGAVAHALGTSGNMKDALRSLFVWTEVFDDEALDRYVGEMQKWVFTAADLGAYDTLLQVQASWRGTAEAYAEGLTPVDVDDEYLSGAATVARP